MKPDDEDEKDEEEEGDEEEEEGDDKEPAPEVTNGEGKELEDDAEAEDEDDEEVDAPEDDDAVEETAMNGGPASAAKRNVAGKVPKDNQVDAAVDEAIKADEAGKI